jgi:hypothetical protein
VLRCWTLFIIRQKAPIILSLWYLHFTFDFLLYIISKNNCVLILYFLILKIVQTLTEESNPSSDLVAAVKHLYKSKLKVCLISDCVVYCFKLYLHLTYYIF